MSGLFMSCPFVGAAHARVDSAARRGLYGRNFAYEVPPVKKYFSTLTAVSVMAIMPALAQEHDPTDLSNYQILDGGDVLPTVDQVKEIKEKANAAFNDDDCDSAIPLLQDWSSQANILSNLLSKTVRPFYRANRDKTDSYISRNRQEFNKLVKVEDEANRLNSERNFAWVLEAECLKKQGHTDEAVTAAYRALEFIEIDDVISWPRAQAIIFDATNYEY